MNIAVVGRKPIVLNQSSLSNVCYILVYHSYRCILHRKPTEKPKPRERSKELVQGQTKLTEYYGLFELIAAEQAIGANPWEKEKIIKEAVWIFVLPKYVAATLGNV